MNGHYTFKEYLMLLLGSLIVGFALVGLIII